MPLMTAIFSDHAETTLTIETSEDLDLVAMTNQEQPIVLKNGLNQVTVGPGIYKLLSNSNVRVTSVAPIYVAITGSAVIAGGTKDGQFPDPPKLTSVNATTEQVRQFFAAKSVDERALE